MSKVISIYNNKGGVGKTTTTKRLAISLLEQSKKVLIVDMDPQGNISSQFEYTKRDKNVADLLLNKADIKEVLTNTKRDNLFLIPSGLNLLEVNNKLMLSAGSLNPAEQLKKHIEPIKKAFDYIIIDCPPTMDLLVTNSLAITDEIIIPIGCDNYSIDGIEMLLTKINQIKETYSPNLKIAGIFLNRFKGANVHKELLKVLQEELPDYTCNTYIGDYSIISEDSFEDQDKRINSHRAGEQFNNLFKELEL